MTDYRYKLTITLLEDLHSGTGAGTVIVDRVQARDEQDRPVLNRTHLKGVLRDNAERLAELGVLDATLIKKMFGDAGDKAGSLECHSLRLQRSVATLLWDATARQPGSRMSEDDSLRRTEYVPAGTIFTGDMLLRDADEDICGKLESVLRFTDRLGSERTRGSGLITLEFSKEPIVRQIAPVDFNGQEANSLCLRLLLRNDEPLCLPRTGFPGNIIDSETYIPGRALFGALCHWALQHQPGDARAQLLFGRQFSIGNAYPLPRGLKDDPVDSLATLAVYPIPLNLYSLKSNVSQANSKTMPVTHWPHWCDSKPLARGLAGHSKELRDEIGAESRRDEGERVPTKRPKPNTYLCALQPPQWWLYDAELALQMRNRRGPPVGEVKRSETDLFTVEQIPAGTWFVTDIAYPSAAPLADFLELYGDLLQQRSKLKIGRGGAPLTISFYKFFSTLPSPSPPESGANPDVLQLTLTSDLIARGDNLGFYQQLSIEVLRNLLGDAACNWNDIRSGAKSDYELQRSFNAASGLPRASVFAIRRGSVLRLEGKGIPKLREQLSKHTALGERTWEGYGRFVLDHYPLDEAVDDPASDPFEQLIVSSEPIGKREAVIRHAESYEKQLKQANLKLPSRSRLGQLLDAVRSLGDSATAEQLRKCLEPFEQATKKKSGQPWKVFFPDNDAEKDLRKKLPKHARDAQLFVETLISLSEYNDK